MLSYRARNGSLTGMNKADITGAGIGEDTPFGDAWTLGAVTARTAIVNWVVSSAQDPDDFSTDLSTALGNVNGAAATAGAYDKPNKTLPVTFRIP